ncbi:DNA polymerase III subunit epsilon [Terricaulis silvestris]|uniref:DNA polymerase III subunit epsilon n=1 Tax=Terricaulis silvestris TaxID=2686094 RepID=A0A6I6N105_9CAUL|nr:DNA polymerase III subunit epsilon [Terricaulis silvestris]QGZ97013.1 DNA polymerase III subunit epsilon [Terricaulis silvestris]
MREIVFDTETTGVFPDHAEAEFRDRIVEIGCVEIVNLERTGREFHVYLNPERSVPEEVVRVHGLTRDFLLQHSKFAEVADLFLEFVGDSPLVAHNAAFDQGFINAELRRLGRTEAPSDRFIDTLQIARKKFPGASCSLDALARRYQLDRYGFDLAARKGAGGHGALIDARILAEVYLQLRGGREQRLVFEAEVPIESAESARPVQFMRREPRTAPLASRMNTEEMAAHEAFIATLGPNALWLKTGS